LYFREYAERCLAKPTSGLSIESDWKITGGPIPGISFYDLQHKIQISTAIILEMKALGFASMGSHIEYYELSASELPKALQAAGISPRSTVFYNIRDMYVSVTVMIYFFLGLFLT
jgi:hypothetical protein